MNWLFLKNCAISAVVSISAPIAFPSVSALIVKLVFPNMKPESLPNIIPILLLGTSLPIALYLGQLVAYQSMFHKLSCAVITYCGYWSGTLVLIGIDTGNELYIAYILSTAAVLVFSIRLAWERMHY